jgi:hypothetical protein
MLQGLIGLSHVLKDPDIAVRTEAMLFLVHHAHIDPLMLLHEMSEVENFSVRSAVAAYLARPGEAHNHETAKKLLEGMAREEGETGERTRQEVARLLGELPDAFIPLGNFARKVSLPNYCNSFTVPGITTPPQRRSWNMEIRSSDY